MSDTAGLDAAGAESLGHAESHFATEPLSEPSEPGRYVNLDSLVPVEFAPGLGFRPVLGQRMLTNFVRFAPGAVAPRHVHEEEQIVIVIEGELVFDLDGDVRTMRKGDVAVIPAWVPHGAWTTDSHCEEIDVFSPPRQSLINLAKAHIAGAGGHGAGGSDQSAVPGPGGVAGSADVA